MHTLAHLQLPWFFPLAVLMAGMGMRTTHTLSKQEGRRGADVWIARILTWFPLAVWLLSQLLSPASEL